MLANILLDEVDLSVWLKVTIDIEFSDLITTMTCDTIVPDVQVVKDHFSFVAILHVNTSPSLVDTGHLELV